MECNLRIKLFDHTPNKIYRAGQVLRGAVTFNCIKQQRIDVAYISFSGRVMTEHQDGNRNQPKKREVIILCDLKQSLFQGPFNVPSQIFEWPFAFTIPTSFAYMREDLPGFLPNGVSPLPSSFEWKTTTYNGGTWASVRYNLKVNVKSRSNRFDQEQEIPVLLQQMPVAPPETSPVRHDFFPPLQWTSRKLRMTQHTLVKKVKHTLSHAPELKTPSLCFRARVHFPEKVSRQHPAHIGFSIKRYTLSSQDPVDPILLLVALEMTLRASLDVKVIRSSLLGITSAQRTNDVAHQCIKFKPQKLSLDGEVVKHPSGVKLADWMTETGAPSSLLDFNSHLIQVRHTMKVKAIIRHEETGHNFQTQAEFPIQIVDGLAPETSVHTPIMMTEPITRMTESTDPELPAYSADVPPPSIDSWEIQNNGFGIMLQ